MRWWLDHALPLLLFPLFPQLDLLLPVLPELGELKEWKRIVVRWQHRGGERRSKGRGGGRSYFFVVLGPLRHEIRTGIASCSRGTAGRCRQSDLDVVVCMDVVRKQW